MSLSAPLTARAMSLSRFCALASTSQSMRKSCIGIDRAVLGRQVADMAERGQDLVALAQIFVDRFRLGGRFYQYKVHVNPLI